MPAKDITYYDSENRPRTVRVNSWELLPCGALRLHWRRCPSSKSIEESPAYTEIIASGQWTRLTHTDIIYRDAYEATRVYVEAKLAGDDEL